VPCLWMSGPGLPEDILDGVAEGLKIVSREKLDMCRRSCVNRGEVRGERSMSSEIANTTPDIERHSNVCRTVIEIDRFLVAFIDQH